MIIETNSASETLALGEKLGKAAKPGQIYTLNGDLGVGKTILTQGFAKGLGITEAVNSPTFTIIQEYESGRVTVLTDEELLKVIDDACRKTGTTLTAQEE